MFIYIMKSPKFFVIIFYFLYFTVKRLASAQCSPSITTASGSSVRNDRFCSGDLIFEDNFNALDFDKWKHENTLSGSGNWEFQWYTNSRSNSFTENGVLHIRPTLTADIYGEPFLSSGRLNINEESPGDACTYAEYWGCERVGNPTNILNPVRSARISTLNSFNFKYGKIEVRAKLPAGDWLWPAIWMLPKRKTYGPWPVSGEIDIVESRGNKRLIQGRNNIGSEQISSSLHFGPNAALDAWQAAHFTKISTAGNGYDSDFHRYQLEWTPDKLTFHIDNEEIGSVNVGTGFWQKGGFRGLDNPWKNGQRAAPFDEEFYIIINLAVGGIIFFPDDAVNPGGKPWSNNSPKAATDFWDGRAQWLPTWNLNQNGYSGSSLLVDYVRVYAL